MDRLTVVAQILPPAVVPRFDGGTRAVDEASVRVFALAVPIGRPSHRMVYDPSASPVIFSW
jgi:hypothetical protein